MVCTCVQKNTSVYAFCHSALLECLTPEKLASRIKVRVSLRGGYSLCRDKLTFVPVESYEMQASRIPIFPIKGLQKPYSYSLQDWMKKKIFLSFIYLSVFNVFAPCTPCPLSDSAYLVCWKESGSEKFLYVRCLVSSVKIPLWLMGSRITRLACSCQHRCSQQKQHPGEGSRILCQECIKVTLPSLRRYTLQSLRFGFFWKYF